MPVAIGIQKDVRSCSSRGINRGSRKDASRPPHLAAGRVLSQHLSQELRLRVDTGSEGWTDEADGEQLLLRVYEAAAPASLTLLLLSSHTDAAAFIRNHPALFSEKTARLAVMGGVDRASLDATCDALTPDASANMSADSEAAAFVFRRCQELGVSLLVLTRFAAYAAPLQSFTFDDLATTGHPVAIALREQQVAELDSLLWRASRPAGDPARESDKDSHPCPARCASATSLRLLAPQLPTFCLKLARHTLCSLMECCWIACASGEGLPDERDRKWYDAIGTQPWIGITRWHLMLIASFAPCLGPAGLRSASAPAKASTRCTRNAPSGHTSR